METRIRQTQTYSDNTDSTRNSKNIFSNTDSTRILQETPKNIFSNTDSAEIYFDNTDSAIPKAFSFETLLRNQFWSKVACADYFLLCLPSPTSGVIRSGVLTQRPID